ncbi:MAG: hypothetical protein HY235_04455 [Acidobacteria bacterium]|nr:hypothetical protein [Acidobacteriota bacterium]
MRFEIVLWLTLPVFAQTTGMPKPNYCFGLLRAAPNRPELPPEEAQRIQKEHLAHLTALGQKRWLVAAGPIATPGELRGILISKCQSVSEANQLASADPAVKHGRLVVESFGWAGPSGIGDRYWEAKAKDPGTPNKMLTHVLVFLRKGPNWNGFPPRETMETHLAHVAALRKAGKMAAAGPFPDGGDWIGVFCFTSGVGLDEAKGLAAQDPLVAGGLARIEAYEWLAAAGTFAQ